MDANTETTETADSIEQQDYLGELLELVDKRFKLAMSKGDDVIRIMISGFYLAGDEQSIVMESLVKVHQEYTNLGSAEYMEAYLIRKEFVFSEKFPNPVTDAKAKANKTMLDFMSTLRDLGFNTADLNELTNSFKAYASASSSYGSAKMELDLYTHNRKG